MRTISEPALAALDSGRFTARCLVHALLPDDETFSVWDDVGDVVIEGVTYFGAAGRFTVQSAPSSYDSAARGAKVTFSGLDPLVAAQVQSSQWHQRPISITRLIIATEAPSVLHLLPDFAGRLDKMVVREETGGLSTVEFLCETDAIENSRSGGRTRSDADQRERDPTDGFFKFSASAATTTIDWGVNPQQAKPRGIARLLDKIF